jgi:hypothetical protein
MQIVSGKDPCMLLDSLAGVSAPGLNPELVGEELFHDIPLAAGETFGVWPKRFLTLEKNVSEFLGELELASGAAGLAEAASRHLERRILESTDFDICLALGASYGAQIEVTQSLDEINPEPGAKQIVLVVTERKKFVGSIAVPARTTPLKPEAIADAVVMHLAWPLMRIHLGLQFPRESRLSYELHALIQESKTISLLRRLISFGYLLMKWQLRHGAMRNRSIFLDLVRMLRELKPVSLGWRLYQANSEERIALGKTALADASRKCVPRQFSTIAERL